MKTSNANFLEKLHKEEQVFEKFGHTSYKFASNVINTCNVKEIGFNVSTLLLRKINSNSAILAVFPKVLTREIIKRLREWESLERRHLLPHFRRQ